MSDGDTRWTSDAIQFPRLLAEIVATQENIDYVALCASMDLERPDVDALFSRAEQAWERIKARASAAHLPGELPCTPMAGAARLAATHRPGLGGGRSASRADVATHLSDLVLRVIVDDERGVPPERRVRAGLIHRDELATVLGVDSDESADLVAKLDSGVPYEDTLGEERTYLLAGSAIDGLLPTQA